MGSGKSSIAKLLHEKLKLPYHDTDILIEKKHGKKISEIFADEGEEKFREYETQILIEIRNENNCIIATGGGIIEKEINHELLKQNSIVIYLKSDPENILKFIGNEQGRPLLQVSNPLDFITKKLKKRTPLYSKLSDFQIETCAQSLDASAKEIVNYLKLLPPFDLS